MGSTHILGLAVRTVHGQVVRDEVCKWFVTSFESALTVPTGAVIDRPALHGLSSARTLWTSRQPIRDRDTTNTGENPNYALRSRKTRLP